MATQEAKLDVLVNNFRLLELAGAADEISRGPVESAEPLLWRRYAQAAREYHSWISAGNFDSSKILETSESGKKIFDHIVSEIEAWTPDQSFRGSYLHFLGAYEAMASLDGDRMVRELKHVVVRLDPHESNQSLDRARAFFAALELPDPTLEMPEEGWPSSYEVMQIVADALSRALDLPEHAFSDVRRFALKREFVFSDPR